MNTEKFTPGKWRAEITCHEFCDTGDYISDFGIVTEENIGIAQCFYNSVVNEEEAEANCHLIAAAPEMYRMLRRIYERLIYLHGNKGAIGLEEIKNVLKKARGEE
jgi:hypothetical protein